MEKDNSKEMKEDRRKKLEYVMDIHSKDIVIVDNIHLYK